MFQINPVTIEQIASDKHIDAAFVDLCRRYKDKGDNHDSWHLRFHWEKLKPQIQQKLLSGDYLFSPCRSVKINDHSIGIWGAEDTLVIKVLSNLLGELILPELSKECAHIKGNGGLKKAVMRAKNSSSQYQYVLKSDVKSYYASMKHSLILKQFKCFIDDEKILHLLRQFLNHLDDVDGELFECTQGIGKGSSLSPLISAMYLHALDCELASYAKRIGGIYIRYVDDWLLLCHKRWHLRKAVKKMNQVLVALRVTKAEKKTFIGRTDRGYDWLGYRIEPVQTGSDDTPPDRELSDKTIPETDNKPDLYLTAHSKIGGSQSGVVVGKSVFRLVVNKTCLDNHFNKFCRLYEQGASREVLAVYVKRWLVWARGGGEVDGDFGRDLVALVFYVRNKT